MPPRRTPRGRRTDWPAATAADPGKRTRKTLQRSSNFASHCFARSLRILSESRLGVVAKNNRAGIENGWFSKFNNSASEILTRIAPEVRIAPDAFAFFGKNTSKITRLLPSSRFGTRSWSKNQFWTTFSYRKFTPVPSRARPGSKRWSREASAPLPGHPGRCPGTSKTSISLKETLTFPLCAPHRFWTAQGPQIW